MFIRSNNLWTSFVLSTTTSMDVTMDQLMQEVENSFSFPCKMQHNASFFKRKMKAPKWMLQGFGWRLMHSKVWPLVCLFYVRLPDCIDTYRRTDQVSQQEILIKSGCCLTERHPFCPIILVVVLSSYKYLNIDQETRKSLSQQISSVISMLQHAYDVKQ